jgi:hypothetical protein
VFPLDGRGVARQTADQATDVVRRTLAGIKSVEVIETGAVEKRLGIHLTEQARACEYDTFCLVEVGEILQSERMLIGHVRRGGKEQKQDEIELKLFVLDVAKASVIDVVVWKFPNREGTLDDAVRVATKRLFAPPDAKVVFDVDPPNAEISLYGEPLSRQKGQVFSYWSGAYLLHATAEGRVPVDVKVTFAEGGPTHIPLQLQPDLLWVAKPKDKHVGNPFGATRHEGSGITSEEAGAAAAHDPRLDHSPWANVIAWSVAGAGVAAIVVGSLVAKGAQDQYNTLSAQLRYSPDETVIASDASKYRDDERSQYRMGAIVLGAGIAAVASGLAWMIIDSATRPPMQEMGDDGRPRLEIGGFEIR